MPAVDKKIKGVFGRCTIKVVKEADVTIVEDRDIAGASYAQYLVFVNNVSACDACIRALQNQFSYSSSLPLMLKCW
jgi:hypothetical protein